MKKLLILIASLCLFGLAGCAVCIDAALEDYEEYRREKYTSRSVEVGDRVEFIDINWPYGTVKFVEYDGKNVEFYETSSKSINENNTLTYCYDNSVKSLYIDYYNTNLRRYEVVKNKVLVVYVPYERDFDCVRVNGSYRQVK